MSEAQDSKKIRVFSRVVLLIISILIFVIAILIDKYPDMDYGLKAVLVNVITTIASTCFAICTINVFYEQWKDGQLKKVIESIPNKVEDIRRKELSEKDPTCPIYVYPPTEIAGNDLSNHIKKAMEISDTYKYTGITMGSMAKIIDSLNGKSITFVIPNPQYVEVGKKYKKHMKSSVNRIANMTNLRDRHIKVVFIFTKFIPSFHIHLTESMCWFAFVDKGKGYLENEIKCPNPVTYAYKKNGENKDDNIEMYYTLKKSCEDMEERHKNEYRYELNQHGNGEIIEYKKTNDGIKKTEKSKKDLLKIFD